MRFVLTLLVLFIHNDGLGAFKFLDFDNPFEIGIISRFIIFFVRNVLGRCSVPLFFIISGYLSAGKYKTYGTFIWKKIQSLLIPYFLWISLIVLLHIILLKIPFLSSFSDEKWGQLNSIKSWVYLYFGKYDRQTFQCSNPAVGQLWYVRDLFIVSLFTPLILFCIKKLPVALILSCLILFFKPFVVYGNLTNAFLFYCLGSLFYIKGFTVGEIDKISKLDVILVLLFVSITSFIYYIFGQNFLGFELLAILTTGLVVVRLFKFFCDNERFYKVLKYLSSYSFWLYAIHLPFVEGTLKVLWLKYLPSKGVWILLEFFLIALLTAVIGVVMGIMFNKCIPSLFRLLNGSRKIK